MSRKVMEDIFISEIVSHERSCNTNPTKNSGVYSCAKDGYAVPVLLVAHVVLLQVQTP
jgi:hypothetical protein